MLSRIDTAFSSVRAFTANASHELRTPIALIRTRVEIALCFPRTSAQYQSALCDVQTSAEQMTEMLDSLLRLARADAGVEQLRCEPVELDALLVEIGAEWVETAQRMNLQFSVQSSSMAIWVIGDATALRRLLRILIDNAFRHTPAYGCVGIELTSSEGIATVSVSDTGVGIAAKDLPHIFERFYRAEPLEYRTRTGGRRAGAGLGLSLAKWITEQHRTHLTVRSVVSSGSTFQFELPLTDGGLSTGVSLSSDQYISGM